MPDQPNTNISKPKAEITPSAQPSQPAAPPQSSPKPDVVKISREQRLQEACEKAFSSVKKLTGSMFSHEAICKKCGWHTMQHSEKEALQLMALHVQRHWRDVAAQVDAQPEG